MCSGVGIANAQSSGDSKEHTAPFRLAVASQPIAAALNDFARQSGLQVVIGSDVAAGVKSTPVEGVFTRDAALQQLLRDTGLRYEYLDARTIAVLGKEKPTADVANATKMLHVAKADESSERGGRSRSRTAEADTAPDAAPNAPSASDSEWSRQGALEEITVTAQKRTEAIQDVPIAISALGGEQLDRSTAGGVQEMLSRVPGVTFEANAQGNGTQVAVRGVSAAFSTVFGASPIAYYVDNVPFGFVRSSILPDPDIYDLQRVEVLRGPQGTLYGAGGAGGVVRVLTKEADLDDLEFKSRVNFSNTEDGGGNGRADAAVNVPIIEGKLAARAMASYKDMSGWIDKPTRDDANGSTSSNFRLKLNGQPTQDLSFGVSAWSSRSDQEAQGWTIDGELDPLPDVESVVNDFDLYGLKVVYDFAGFSLSSSTGYLEYEAFTAVANDNNTVTRVRPTAETFVQEVNLTSNADGPWLWTAGAIYRDGQDRRSQRNPNTGFVQDDKYTSESWAVFGELTRQFADGLFELTGGLRYFHDDVGIQELQRAVAVQPAQLVDRDTEFDATTPRVVLKWRPGEFTMVYASYSEGFRSGGDQQPSILAINLAIPPFEPDLLKNYEIGMKGDLVNGLLSYDAAVYFLEWEDVQLPLALPVDGPLRALLVNGASADGPGAEFSVTARPFSGTELGVNMSWNDLTVSKPVFAGTNNSVLVYAEGDRLNSSAEYTAGAFASYSFPLTTGGLNGRLSLSGDYSSRRDIRLYTGGASVVASHSDSLIFGRASFAVESQDRWAATLYVDNLTNENGIANAFVIAPTPVTPARSLRPRPRTYGVQLEYRY